MYTNNTADYFPYKLIMDKVWDDDALAFKQNYTDLEILIVAMRFSFLNPNNNNKPATPHDIAEALKRRDPQRTRVFANATGAYIEDIYRMLQLFKHDSKNPFMKWELKLEIHEHRLSRGLPDDFDSEFTRIVLELRKDFLVDGLLKALERRSASELGGASSKPAEKQ